MIDSSSYSEWDDSDGDGIPDHLESSQMDLQEELNVNAAPADFDGDGIPDDFDEDDDNDGVPDVSDSDSDSDEIPNGDFDDDGIPDEFDEDDDNDGVPDVFEYEHIGKHMDPWENEPEDVRSILCPRIKANLTCGKHLQVSGQGQNV